MGPEAYAVQRAGAGRPSCRRAGRRKDSGEWGGVGRGASGSDSWLTVTGTPGHVLCKRQEQRRGTGLREGEPGRPAECSPVSRTEAEGPVIGPRKERWEQRGGPRATRT